MSDDQKILTGKTSLITGASGGIGRAVSLELASLGANLVLASRSKAALDDTAREADSRGAGDILVQPTDVRDEAQVRNLAEAAGKQFGRLDVLINNAGLGYSGRIEDSDPSKIREMIDVNVWGAYLVARYMLPLMPGPGEVVNVSSVAGLKYSPGFAMYSATKFSVRAMSEAMRNEIQDRDIRVLTVYPGMTHTHFFEFFAPGGKPPVPADKGDILTPENVARAMIHAITLPRGTAVNEIVIRPTWQER
jgi:NADP-dependent 3-hydroxy acid dehydrogenase YdfG